MSVQDHHGWTDRVATDSLEAKGRPYAESVQTLLTTAMRAVLGRRLFGLRPGDWSKSEVSQ